ALELARRATDTQVLLPALGGACRAQMLLGRVGEARPLAQEFVSLLRERRGRRDVVGMIADYAEELGIAEEARELMADAQDTRWKEAAMALLDDDFVRAADVYGSMKFAAREAEVRLQAAERLIRVGRRSEGEIQLQ